MASTTQLPHDDYELDERELDRPLGSEHPDSDYFDDADLQPHSDDIRRDNRHFDDLDREHETHSVPPKKNEPEKPTSFWGKYRLYLIVGAFGLVLFGLLVVAVLKMMAPQPVQRKTPPADFTSQPMVQRSNTDNSAATDPVLFDREALTEPQRDMPMLEKPQEPTEQAILQVAPITQRTEQEQDDKFYDELVRSSDRGSPVEQRTPVQPVSVSSRTDDKIEALSQAISDSSREMGIVLNAVKVLSEDVKSLRVQVQESSSKTSDLEGKLGKVSVGLAELTQKTEAQFKQISAKAVSAAMAAVGKEQKPKQEKLVLVGGKRESDYRPATKPVVTAAKPASSQPVAQPPVRVAANVVPRENKGDQGQQCKARTVSQNWKVKGITNHGAYVRRTDGEAAMLRIGSEVSGFGQVVGFDPESRTVCTTKGLIAR